MIPEAKVYVDEVPIAEDVREEINNIEEIPDVKDYDNFEEAVLALYRAGIFAGTDAEGL